MVYDDLEVVQSEGTSSLVANAIEIMACVRQLERNALHAKVNQSFMIARSHYRDSIDLEMMSHGFMPGYEVYELEEMEAVVAPLSHDLVDRIVSDTIKRGTLSKNRKDRLKPRKYQSQRTIIGSRPILRLA